MALSPQRATSIFTRQSTSRRSVSPSLAHAAISARRAPEVAYATTSPALAGHGAEFALPDVPSPDALRQLAKLDPMRQLGRPRRLLGGAERSLRVHAETVRHQRDPLACVVTALRQRFHCRLPVRFFGQRLHEDRASPVRPARCRDSGRIPGPSPSDTRIRRDADAATSRSRFRAPGNQPQATPSRQAQTIVPQHADSAADAAQFTERLAKTDPSSEASGMASSQASRSAPPAARTRALTPSGTAPKRSMSCRRSVSALTSPSARLTILEARVKRRVVGR